ncbi:hypothetical protein B0J15DRAFT_465976 [Fusarium solani]|uniref:Uncharacterized protein n=1 Tax=Fusarium solani TaxID=169388 RepID=A0A9P9HJF3_FUSSL|nr:uncharacterized protein B0J15DRAFT_465976 [Fusarium solani]KAH7258724.1 hypothetical protein B0J15DRAFT_465976 [Fusarium solani]
MRPSPAKKKQRKQARVSLAFELCHNTFCLLRIPEHPLPRTLYENKMKRTSLTRRDASRPSDQVPPRPRKAARTSEPEPSTNKSDTEEVPPTLTKKQADHCVLTSPFPQTTALSLVNAPTTPMPSSGMQEVIAAMNDRFDKERAEMIESFRNTVQLEIAEVLKRLDAQDAVLEAQSKALQDLKKEVAASSKAQIEALQNLKKDMVAILKAIEAGNKQTQAPDVGTSLAERDMRQHHEGARETETRPADGRAFASRLPTTEDEESQGTVPSRPAIPVCKDGKIILNTPDGWEPPMEAPLPGPKKTRLSVRGSKISRHPLADPGDVPPYQSATQRAIKRAYGSNDDTKNDT